MKKVLDFVQRFDLLPRYELLLAAASGGLDSMCLLDFLYENGYRVCAAHYNHQLRGQEADMDEDLVRAWCAARRIPLCVGTGDVAAYARGERPDNRGGGAQACATTSLTPLPVRPARRASSPPITRTTTPKRCSFILPAARAWRALRASRRKTAGWCALSSA